MEHTPAGRLALAVVVAAVLAACGGGDGAPATQPTEAPLKLHVPSPDWQDQIIYFVVTDRFADGDPSNNDQGAGEFDPTKNEKYSGGDLKGIRQKIDYIKGLGATTVWITPPVANQWWDPIAGYGGYHGYWAENFMQVDRHVGTLDDYKQLSHALHSAGMYLVQDIVVNHMGNFYSYQGGWDPNDPTKHFTLNTGSVAVAAPTQWPFTMNDARLKAHRDAGIFRWTPQITDYEDPVQFLNFQISDLDEMNTENPVVRDALRQSYGYWIKEVGVDGFRIDTVFYVPPDYFKDFLGNTGSPHPGITAVAKATGRDRFLSFGEGFAEDKPGQDLFQRKIDSYMTDPASGEDILPGMINFTLYGTATDVFARGRPTADLSYRIRRTMELHRRPHLMPTFLDNHDVSRFLSGGSEPALRQNLLMMMTLPGIPVIYYGTEQGFTEQRGAMFAAGYRSGGKDWFDTSAPLYRYIASVTALRKAHKVFSRGTPTVLKDNGAAPGSLAYRMSHEGAQAFVVFNTADHPSLLDNLPTGLPAGTVLKNAFALDGAGRDLVVGAGGRLTLALPARAGYVWLASAETRTPPTPGATITITALDDAVQTGDFTVSGTASGLASVQLVVDDDLGTALTVPVAADGSWSATVDTGTMIDPALRHGVVAWDPASGAVSTGGTFFVRRNWVKLAELADPAGDDTGPGGRYVYPTDVTWGANRQLDLRKVTVYGAGGAMKLDLQINQVTTVWNPPNGFDHVAFTVYIELPGRPGGVRLMPQQNATLPGGMTWHYRLRAHGWSNALFSSAGASAGNEGTPVTPAATIAVDRATNTISFTLQDRSLGKPSSLAGARVYVTTWDYDGGYRPINPDVQQYQFGGGNFATDPLVMDDTAVITLP